MQPGAIRLVVNDVDRVRDFYERAIGLRAAGNGQADLVRLGPEGGGPLVELVADPAAPPRPPGTTGLFHLAILFPGRRELAAALRRAVEANAAIGGASDHLVSEALYLRDPEGNGIELYRDRPRSEWKYAGGRLQMSTLPLDTQGLLRELDGEAPAGAPAETGLGHVHLNVADLEASRHFYGDLLGLEITVDDYPGALFFAAGDYHHHIGVNTWAGDGAPAPEPGSAGLRWFELLISEEGELGQIATRLGEAGFEPKSEGEGILAADPSQNQVLLKLDDRRG